MRKNELGYEFVDFHSLARKIWALENDWGALCKVFNAIILWRTTQRKKMMRYLNKQNFCVTYMDVGRQSKKWENDVLNGESGTIPLW